MDFFVISLSFPHLWKSCVTNRASFMCRLVNDQNLSVTFLFSSVLCTNKKVQISEYSGVLKIWGNYSWFGETRTTQTIRINTKNCFGLKPIHKQYLICIKRLIGYLFGLKKLKPGENCPNSNVSKPSNDFWQLVYAVVRAGDNKHCKDVRDYFLIYALFLLNCMYVKFER